MGLEKYHKLTKELEKYLRFETFPLAIKMIENEGEIPEKTVRPSRDMNKRLMVCQGFGICKAVGRTMAFTHEDTSCMTAATKFGWLESAPYLEDGSGIMSAGLAKNAAVAKLLEQSRPALGPEYHYIGIVISPLGWTRVEPQMVLFYINAARLARCLDSITGETGEVITAQTNGRGGPVFGASTG